MADTSLITINPGSLVVPGESAVVAIANLVSKAMDGQTPEQKAILWQRFIDIMEPWHKIAVAASADAAAFIAKLMQMGPK